MAAEVSPAVDPLGKLDTFERLDALEKQPLWAQVIALMKVDSLPRQLFMRHFEFRELDGAQDAILALGSWGSESRYADALAQFPDAQEIVRTLITRTRNHLRFKAGQPLSLSERLAILTQSSRRIASRILFKQRVSGYLDENQLPAFVRAVWNADENKIDDAVRNAILADFHYFLSNKKFTRATFERRSLGKLTPEQVLHMVQITREGIAGLEEVIRLAPAAERRQWAHDNAEARADTRKNLLREVPAYLIRYYDLGALPLDTALTIEKEKREVIQQLRGWWDEGNLPVYPWLQQRPRAAFLRLAIQRFGNIENAYDAAGLPIPTQWLMKSLLYRFQGSEGGRQRDSAIKSAVFALKQRRALVTFQDLYEQGILTAVVMKYGGSWQNALSQYSVVRNLGVPVAPLPSLLPTAEGAAANDIPVAALPSLLDEDERAEPAQDAIVKVQPPESSKRALQDALEDGLLTITVPGVLTTASLVYFLKEVYDALRGKYVVIVEGEKAPRPILDPLPLNRILRLISDPVGASGKEFQREEGLPLRSA